MTVRKHSAFTLLEMMLSIAVFVLLVTSAFTLVGSATELMTEISEHQKTSAVPLRFVETCRAAFETTTAKSELDFDYVTRGTDRYDTYLSLSNAPGAFAFDQLRADDIERVILAAEHRPDGGVRARVYYLTASEFEIAEQENFTAMAGLRFIELVPRMRQLSWRFHDPRTREWRATLDDGLKTSLIELTIQINDSEAPLRSVFYVVNSDQ